jgi:hypothetical protein
MKAQQIRVDRLGLGGRHAVGEPGVRPQLGVLEQLRGQRRRVGIRNDLVVVAVHDQDGHGDLFQVVGEIGLRERDDTVVMRLRAAHHALTPPVLDDRLGRRRARAVEPVERSCRDRPVELRAVRRELCLEVVENLLGQADGVGLGLHHQRRHGVDLVRSHPAKALVLCPVNARNRAEVGARPTAQGSRGRATHLV